MSKLNSSLRTLKKQTEPRQVLLSGDLGITLGGHELVEVPGRPGYVYVRLLNNLSELIQVYNGVVSPIYGLPILVERNKDRYEIQGRDTLRYQDWGNTPYLPIHGNQHSFNKDGGGGGDLVWVHQEQFYPLATIPSGTYESPSVTVLPYIYNWYGDWHYYAGGSSPPVAAASPSGSSATQVLLLCLDGDTELLHFITGSIEAPFLISGSAALIPYIPSYDPSDDIPLAVICVTTGTTTIGWDEIYDVRQFYGREQSGGGTGSAGVSDHNDLNLIDGGAPGEYYHFTHLQHDDLTDGGTTVLHSHALPILTPNRVVITDDTGVITVDNNLYYDDNVMIMGANTVPATYPVAHHLVSESDGATLDLWTYSDADASYWVSHRARNTILSPAELLDNDVLLYIRGRGYDGAWTGSRAGITFRTTEDWASGTSNGTEMVFHTTPTGTALMSTEITFDGRGVINLPVGATYNINGVPHAHASTGTSGGISDASELTYTPAVNADWDGGVDPGNGDDAFDQLAERVTDIESTPPAADTIKVEKRIWFLL